MFHSIDEDERLLSIASDIEGLNAKLRATVLGRLENIVKFRRFDDYLFFHVGRLVQ
jgi:hypothetical protein